MLEYLEKKKTLLVYLPLGVYWLVLFILTSMPSANLPKSFEFNDKMEHTSAFAVLGMLLSLAITVQKSSKYFKSRAWLGSLIIGATYGAFDELHQLFVVGRSCDFFDWMADITGTSVGIIITYAIIKISARKSNLEIAS